jgi:hypothetical protein
MAAVEDDVDRCTVDDVSPPRRRSTTIPILADGPAIERVSLYDPRILEHHPLIGARLRNTGGKHLMQGPITALDGGVYAGDARLDHLPPGQERLIGHAVDVQVLVNAPPPRHIGAIQKAKLV